MGGKNKGLPKQMIRKIDRNNKHLTKKLNERWEKIKQ